MAERVRKIGGTTLRSIGHIAKLQTIEDNDEDFVAPGDMLRELMNDNKKVAEAMRKAHEVCDEHDDVATASMLEIFIDANREADLVPVRGEPRRINDRPLNAFPVD